MWNPNKTFVKGDNCGKSVRMLILASAAILLSACSGGSDSSNNDEQAVAPPPATAATVSTNSEAGLAIDGPVSGASVVLLEADGDQIATATTDATGRFNVEVPTNALYPLTARLTGGTDIVTNSPSSMRLAGIINTADEPILLSLFSTLAVRNAEECVPGLTEAQRRTARNGITNASVAALLNSEVLFGLNSSVRNQLLSNIPTNSNLATSLLFASEQLAETIRRTATATGSTPDAVLTTIACDLGNGSIDGLETGTTTNNAAVFQLIAAEVGLEAAAGRLKIAGVIANSAINAALSTTFGITSANVAALTVTLETLNQLKKIVNAAIAAQSSPSLTQLAASLNVMVAPVSPASFAVAIDALANTTPLRPIINAPVIPVSTLLAEIKLPGSSVPPVISLFSATPSSFGTAAGGLTTLNWVATGATACSRTGSGLGWNGGSTTSGTIANVGPVILNSIFTLSCSGPGGSVSSSVNVVVLPSAAITFVPAIAEFAEMVTVNISPVNADSCNATLLGGSSPVSIVSGGTFAADVGLSVDVTCNGPGGTGVANKSLPVRAARLTWDAPTVTEDGTPVSLEKFVIYHGTTPKSRTDSIMVNDPNAREFTQGFPDGPRYFEITAISNGGFEGRYSNEAFKEIP